MNPKSPFTLSPNLHWQIFAAIIIAFITGSFTETDTNIFGIKLLGIYRFIGTLFLNALKMLIVPLIFSAIIVGIGNIRSQKGFGILGFKTLAWYIMTSFLAIITGLLLVNFINPGAGINMDIPVDQASVVRSLEQAGGKGIGDVAEVFIRMVPPNIVKAAANGQMLGLIFFSLLYGYLMGRIPDDLARVQKKFWNGMYQIMMKMTDLVMKAAPIGVFGLIASAVVKSGFEHFIGVLLFFITVLSALGIHMFFTLPILMKIVAGINPILHFKAMSPAILTAFSTSSSAATLPITLDCVEQKAGVSNRTSCFVLPLGATVNMDGTALYECVSAMFIAQAYGVEMTFATQFLVVTMALMTSIGVAGIPSASLVAIGIILGSIGLPLEGMAMILVTDRILDMCRTGVNVFSDSCGAVVIAESQGEETLLKGSLKNKNFSPTGGAS